jgi:hypothetical protein
MRRRHARTSLSPQPAFEPDGSGLGIPAPISPPVPTMPPAIGAPPSTSSRMVSACGVPAAGGGGLAFDDAVQAASVKLPRVLRAINTGKWNVYHVNRLGGLYPSGAPTTPPPCSSATTTWCLAPACRRPPIRTADHLVNHEQAGWSTKGSNGTGESNATYCV